jgi:hypothetical protein
MLRHIVSASLAMTACVTFIPTNASAVTLTVRPVGEIPKNPGDSIEFIFSLNPGASSALIFKAFNEPGFDGNELSLNPDKSFTLAQDTFITNSVTVARRTFDVITPFKGGGDDVFNASVSYLPTTLSGTPTSAIRQSTSLVSGGDVVPVPEPITMFGTAIGLGCGVLFKRKSSKKIVS